MIIADSAAAAAEETRDEIVGQGPVYRQTLIDAKATGGFSVLLVTFAPGARLNFHTQGKGIVATRDEERVVTAGEVIYIAPGEAHWHGAAPDASFAHIAIQRPGIQLA